MTSITSYNLSLHHKESNEPLSTNLTYFAFCSVVRTSTLDIRGPGTEFSFDFFLKLSQNFVNVAAPVVSNIASPLPKFKFTESTAGHFEAL